jgi:hypothetical protein
MIARLFVAFGFLLCVVGAAYLFRYEPILGRPTGVAALVWDRWLQQVCLVGIGTRQRIVCSHEDAQGIEGLYGAGKF